MTLAAGTRFGSYEVVGPIGAGGMGVVYRACDTKLQRDVAVKVLPDILSADPDRLARFTREAQTLALLNHPNIAQVYGLVDLPAGSGALPGAALVMECVEGEDLGQRLARGPVPVDEALEIARQIAEGFEAAHERVRFAVERPSPRRRAVRALRSGRGEKQKAPVKGPLPSISSMVPVRGFAKGWTLPFVGTAA